MHRLWLKMKSQQTYQRDELNPSYLLNSVEDGVRRILERDRATAVFGGRETLYFNMKKFGIRNFQLSEKLFTRYSGISLQKGCLFLDKLNDKWVEASANLHQRPRESFKFLITQHVHLSHLSIFVFQVWWNFSRAAFSIR